MTIKTSVFACLVVIMYLDNLVPLYVAMLFHYLLKHLMYIIYCCMYITGDGK